MSGALGPRTTLLTEEPRERLLPVCPEAGELGLP